VVYVNTDGHLADTIHTASFKVLLQRMVTAVGKEAARVDDRDCSSAWPLAWIKASRVRASVLRSTPLAFENTCSIGLRSDE
jgi:hypothetical protein